MAFNASSLRDASVALDPSALNERPPSLWSAPRKARKQAQIPDWCSRHHVIESRRNVDLPPARRMLFDVLPQLRVRRGKYADVPLYMVGDIHDDPGSHEELLKWKWLQYPHFANLSCPSSRPGTTSRPSTHRAATQGVELPSLERDTDLPSSRRTRKSMGSPRIRVKTERTGDPELMEFLRWCESKHGHLVNTWRKLDKHGNMMVCKSEFLNGLRDMGWTSCGQKLWSLFNCEQEGHLSFINFVPDLAIDLARFKRWAEQQFGGFRAAFRAFDSNGNGQLTYKEFSQSCERFGMWQKLKDIVPVLFVMIDDGNHDSSRGVIVEEELDFLDRWKCPPYLWAEPDFAAQKEFRKQILSSFLHNPLVAWRRAVDKDGCMKVSYPCFVKSCTKFVKAGAKNHMEQINRIYITYDPYRSGYISLRGWDKESFRVLAMFTSWARREFGKVSNAVIAWEKERGNGVLLADFRTGIEGIGMTEQEIRLLWTGLSCDGLAKKNGKLTREELMFLDRWDPAQQAEEELAWESMIRKGFGMSSTASSNGRCTTPSVPGFFISG